MRFPIALELQDRPVTVVGGGRVAARKIGGLLAAGARVTAIAPTIAADLAGGIEARGGTVLRRGYRAGDLNGATLAFAATDDAAVNAAVLAEARRLGIWCNDASGGARGDFTTPAVHRTGTLTFAVDTGGAVPNFARRLRAELAARYDDRYPAALERLTALREAIVHAPGGHDRTALLETLSALDIDALAALPAGDASAQAGRLMGGLRCATRASALALTQTALVTAALARAGIACDIVPVSTTGDEVQDRSLVAIGSESLFVKELERALADGRADFAVHSCKDLPSTAAEGMTLAAFSQRADPRDVFCSERYPDFAALPAGARVGTSSQRRRALLQAMRPDLRYDDIRGNVDTRLRKLRDGEYDAILLAAAGLERLGVRAAHSVPFATAALLPAAGQGILAVECRSGDALLAALLHALLNDPAAELAALAERAFLAAMQGGCSVPIGIHARLDDGALTLEGVIATIDGSRIVRGSATATASREEAVRAGRTLAGEIMGRGGAAILATFAGHTYARLAGKLFLLARTLDRPSRIAPILRAAGADVLEIPPGEAAGACAGERIPDVVLLPSSGSARAVGEYVRGLRNRGHRPLVAAMGPSSAQAAAGEGFPADVVAGSADAESLVAAVTQHLSEHRP